MLELKGITLQAGSFSLEVADLHIQQGECHVVLGPTGSGKTLLLEAVLGLRELQSGSIFLHDKDISDYPVEQRMIGYVPQDLALFPHLSVKDNIFYGNRVRSEDVVVAANMIDELIDAVAIRHLLARMPGNLSGGERQRVALVRAIASGSKLLLLDEPFSALNESLRKDLWLMIRELRERYRLTLMMITHDLEEAFFLGDSMSVLIDGYIHQSADKHTVYHQPASEEVAQYFGIKNLYQGKLIESGSVLSRVFCGQLGVELATRSSNYPRGMKNGDMLALGIRANEVMVLREDLDPGRWSNTLSGQITVILDKGASYTVLFQPDGASGLVEIELNSHAFRRLHLQEGARRHVSLKEENLFIIKSAEKVPAN